MADNNERIQRITRFEGSFDRISAAADKLSEALDEYEALAEEMDELDEYYTGEDWRGDFEADEEGLLPANLKRGVLSEDGLYDLFGDISLLETRLASHSKYVRIPMEYKTAEFKLQKTFTRMTNKLAELNAEGWEPVGMTTRRMDDGESVIVLLQKGYVL